MIASCRRSDPNSPLKAAFEFTRLTGDNEESFIQFRYQIFHPSLGSNSFSSTTLHLATAHQRELLITCTSSNYSNFSLCRGTSKFCKGHKIRTEKDGGWERGDSQPGELCAACVICEKVLEEKNEEKKKRRRRKSEESEENEGRKTKDPKCALQFPPEEEKNETKPQPKPTEKMQPEKKPEPEKTPEPTHPPSTPTGVYAVEVPEGVGPGQPFTIQIANDSNVQWYGTIMSLHHPISLTIYPKSHLQIPTTGVQTLCGFQKTEVVVNPGQLGFFSSNVVSFSSCEACNSIENNDLHSKTPTSLCLPCWKNYGTIRFHSYIEPERRRRNKSFREQGKRGDRDIKPCPLPCCANKGEERIEFPNGNGRVGGNMSELGYEVWDVGFKSVNVQNVKSLPRSSWAPIFNNEIEPVVQKGIRGQLSLTQVRKREERKATRYEHDISASTSSALVA
ncbi:hypothetical protein TL16_g03629 [Triparma laevis f. inornata]|uniref:Uncharacterized protein n=1 Tax=Triparma laevis f. inornata TaxID=1714386 RepID=A0A9W7E2Q7_9STRA|nr:hypothetical protein TL16_g03629 [Triparma laevis f. inornata]